MPPKNNHKAMAKLTPKLIGKPTRKLSEQPNRELKEKPMRVNRFTKGPKIPSHFQKNSIVTYSQTEIESELEKYPGLLKTLGHAYQYQITVTGSDTKKEYWFCRDIQTSLTLLKYLNEQGWKVDWQEKPFNVA